MVLVTAAALLAAGCGDDGGGGGGGEASTEISATATEFQFEADEWTVPAGEEITIDFTNDGGAEHEWALLSGEIGSESEFEEALVLFEVEAIPAGESDIGTFTVDEPGTYQVICAIDGHFDAGMEGTLTVE